MMGAREATRHPAVHTEGKLLLCKCGGCWRLPTHPNLTINERDIHTDREDEGYSECESESSNKMLNCHHA